MEPNESIISSIKAIPDDELDELLVLTQVEDYENNSEFKHHQTMDIPLNTTDLFREEEEKTKSDHFKEHQKYPEYNLSFSLESGPSLLLRTQKSDLVELTIDSNQNNHEESIFVHPHIKDEPLDLSFQYSPVTAPKTSEDKVDPIAINNDFNLEQPIVGSLGRPITPDLRIFETSMSDNETGLNSSRRSPMEYLTLNYSQASLEEAGVTTANTRRELQISQSILQVDTTLIPNSVHRLYETIKKAYSDFAFVYSLAAQMCQDRVPMDCFVHLKIGLLLSIASLEENPDRPPISIVAIGPEFSMANYLMENIGNVAERFVGPNDDFKVMANKSGQHTWIEADPIVMARGGIYYVGDWARLKAPRSFKLLKTIECGRIALERNSISCPLEAAVWTHWRSYKYDTKDQHTFNKFLEIFGIPLIIEEENHEVLTNLKLEQASLQVFESTVDELSIGEDDMRKFLAIISKRRVDLTNEASEILRKYFVSSRMDRPDCLTQQSYSTLKLFAESFAKLSLRHEVISIDAIAAIYMTENVIQNVFGPGAYPPPKYQAHTYIGAVDEHLLQFQEWVNRYVAQFLENE